MQGDVVEQLGQLLREVGFESGPYDSLIRTSGGLPPADALAALDRPQDARLAALAALFADTGTSLPRGDAEQALRPVAVDDLIAAGLLEVDGAGVRSRVSLFPFDRTIVVGDRLGERTGPNYATHVTPATKTLASLVIRRHIGTMLDLGTGSGALALLAARHAEQVTGVDINPRALSHARLGQRLNGFDNLNWAEGDWFEPVEGQQFDLVMVNPPFAISPDERFVDLESSATGDELSRRLVREGAQHVAEGGLAIQGCNWIHRGEEWDEPLREWTAGLGCDALLIHFVSQDPLAYAMTWHKIGVGSNASDHGDVTRWVNHHKRLGVEKVGWGAIVLRRRTGGENWIRAFRIPGGPTAQGGDQLERVFAGCDFLERRPAAEQFGALLSTPWRLAEGHQVDQSLLYKEGTYAVGQAVFRQEGLNLRVPVDTRMVPVLAAFNGERPLRQLIEETPVPEGLDQRAFQTLCLETVRELIAAGYMVGKPLESL